MNSELDILANGVFVCIYIFGIIPVIGWKSHSKIGWSGNDYSNRLYRGIYYHAILFVAVNGLWAINHNIFN